MVASQAGGFVNKALCESPRPAKQRAPEPSSMPRPSTKPKRWEGTGTWSHCHVVEYASGLQLVNTKLKNAMQRLPCSIEKVADHLLVSVADLPADLVAFLYPRDDARGCSRSRSRSPSPSAAAATQPTQAVEKDSGDEYDKPATQAVSDSDADAPTRRAGGAGPSREPPAREGGAAEAPAAAAEAPAAAAALRRSARAAQPTDNFNPEDHLIKLVTVVGYKPYDETIEASKRCTHLE